MLKKLTTLEVLVAVGFWRCLSRSRARTGAGRQTGSGFPPTEARKWHGYAASLNPSYIFSRILKTSRYPLTCCLLRLCLHFQHFIISPPSYFLFPICFTSSLLFITLTPYLPIPNSTSSLLFISLSDLIPLLHLGNLTIFE